MRTFNLVIIGSGPAGQKAAIQAAKLGKSVCVVERMQVVGGVAINTGTIPSKALREAVLDQIGATPYSRSELLSKIDRRHTLATLIESCQRVIRAEVDVVRRHFGSNGIEVIYGTGSFASPNTVNISGSHSTETVAADFVLVATGTTPARPESMPFDDRRIMTSDEVLHMPVLPKTMIVVGGGVIGTEYASMLAELGVRVTLIEGRTRLLEFLDSEISEAFQYHFRQAGGTLRMGEKVVSIRKIEASNTAKGGEVEMVEAVLESGKTLRAESLLYAIGRQGSTASLNLAAAGLDADDRGRIKVNEHYQTAVPTIYAAGDVIGFPALASTSMEQGRLAACHMFGEPTQSVPDLFPFGIYSIPEISMVGWTEERLTAAGVPYESGVAQYKEIARGQLLGDEIGMLKLLMHQETHVVLGVHAIGTHATELIHIGQAVMAFNGTAEYFVNTVFNYPTLAECYKVAALNGLNKIRNL
ncbi:MAG: Si-specific NAD(P)(+) transhydrogenase [Phycisphaerales bacterium]